MRTNDIPPLTAADVCRFLSKITIPTKGCWLWEAGKSNAGYGRFRVGDVVTGAHRVAYSLFRGPVAEGLVLDHLCKTPNCVNPWHLDAVTNAENIGREVSRRTHCSKGHLYVEENIRLVSAGNKLRRTCLQCYRDGLAAKRKTRLTNQ